MNPTFDFTPFAQASKTSVDQIFGVANAAFQGVEALTALNLQATKTLLSELAEGSQAALSARSPEDLIKLQTALLQAAPQKAAAYSRQVKEIVESSFAEQRAAAEAKIAEVQSQFVDAVSGMLKNAPGAENTVALVKSAVAASNNAYESVNKASKQVAEVVEANVTKLTETATKANRAAA